MASWSLRLDVACAAFSLRGQPGGASSRTLWEISASLVKTVMFMEIAAEIPVDQRISKHPALVNCMEELVLYLDRRVTTGRKQAPMFLVSVVEALERAVVDMDLPRYVRGYAWYKLFKLWGGMRFNDTQGIEVSSMRLTAKGLVADITQSKTTGPGKAVTRISVYVDGGEGRPGRA